MHHCACFVDNTLRIPLRRHDFSGHPEDIWYFAVILHKTCQHRSSAICKAFSRIFNMGPSSYPNLFSLKFVLKFISTWRQHGRVVRAPDWKSVGCGFLPLADVVLGNPEFNFSTTLVNSQLVCLPPVGILNLVMFIWIFIYHCLFTLVLKSPNGEWPITYTFYVYSLKVVETSVTNNSPVFLELPSPGRTHYTNYWYSWVQTIYYSLNSF